MANLLGFQITRNNNDLGKPAEAKQAFTVSSPDDGTTTIAAGGHFGQYMDMEVTAKNDIDLIKRYREIAQHPECDMAIEDIINEVIVSDERDASVSVSLDKLMISDNIKMKVRDEFDEVLRLLNFDEKGHDIFRRWYVDGRIYFHKVIDPKSPRKGLTEIRYIDPRKIKKVRDVKKEKDPKTGVSMVKEVKEYFIYDDKGIANKPGQYKAGNANDKSLKISKDAVTYIPSGLLDQDKNIPLSYLHKAIRPANQLRMMENAVVVYRITRAPERRVFYVDTGNLPTMKAEQYLKDIMNRYRNKLVYDGESGEIRDDKKFMSMLEDFWMPRREGGRGTEIQTLPGGSNLGETGDVDYFQRKLYQALNVPISRLEGAQQGLNFGRSAEISRDELKFTKFIAKLRRRFSAMFDDLVKTQLILKGIITEDDWPSIRDGIQYKYASDAYYTESKEQEILRSRVEVLNGLSNYVGEYFSKEYVQKEILKMRDDEIDAINKQIDGESLKVEPQQYEGGNDE